MPIQSPSSGTLTVEANGKTYTAQYTVERGTLIVSAALGSRKTQLGGSTPKVLATRLLNEMIASGELDTD